MNESVIIVGAGSGLSASLARLCASKNMNVVLAARNIDKLQDLKDKNRTDIFKNIRGLIVLLPSKLSNIGHYIAMIPKRNHITYFSSLGNSPTQEAKLLHNDEGIIKSILGKHFVYNRRKLQSGDFQIRSCAMFCVARLYFSELKSREFGQLFTNNVVLSTPDEIVSMLCILPFSEV